MPFTSLVVDVNAVQAATTAKLLKSLGDVVITATSFDDGRRQLFARERLDLLVADVRLGPFNGLQLAIRARALFPSVRVIITDRTYDPTLAAETTRIGGVYITGPVTRGDIATVRDQALPADPQQPRPARRWPRKAVHGAVSAAIGRKEAKLLDVSYGGLCFEVSRTESDGSLPSALELEMASLGLSLVVHPVWGRTAEAAGWLFGGEVVAGDRTSETLWRQFVDSCGEA